MKEGFRTGGMRNRRDAEQEGCRTGGMQNRRDTGQLGCRTAWDTRLERCRNWSTRKMKKSTGKRLTFLLILITLRNGL